MALTSAVSGSTTAAQPLTPQQQTALKNLHKVAVQFEGIFVGMLLREMRKGESDQTIFGEKTNGQKIYEEMLDDQRSQEIASTGSFGIAKMLEAQLRSAVLANAGREAQSSTRGLLR
jgi:Rod binding domain-containing protein